MNLHNHVSMLDKVRVFHRPVLQSDAIIRCRRLPRLSAARYLLPSVTSRLSNRGSDGTGPSVPGHTQLLCANTG